jgi:hypothetical protein
MTIFLGYKFPGINLFYPGDFTSIISACLLYLT